MGSPAGRAQFFDLQTGRWEEPKEPQAQKAVISVLILGSFGVREGFGCCTRQPPGDGVSSRNRASEGHRASFSSRKEKTSSSPKLSAGRTLATPLGGELPGAGGMQMTEKQPSEEEEPSLCYWLVCDGGQITSPSLIFFTYQMRMKMPTSPGVGLATHSALGVKHSARGLGVEGGHLEEWVPCQCQGCWGGGGLIL